MPPDHLTLGAQTTTRSRLLACCAPMSLWCTGTPCWTSPKVRLPGDTEPASPWFARRNPLAGKSPRSTTRWKAAEGPPR